MCAPNEYFNSPDGKCYPIKTTAVDESKYDGSTSIWGYVPAALPGIASIIASLKGGSTAPVTNNYNTGNSTGGNTIWFILGGVVLLIVLFVAMKK